MVRRLLIVLLVYAAFVLEAMGIGSDPTGVEPRWLCLAAAMLVWMLPLPFATLGAAACGLLADAVSAGPPGLGVATFGAGGWMFGWWKRSRRWQSTPAFLVITFTVTASIVLMTERYAVAPADAPDWRTLGLTAAGQGAMTSLWAGGLAATAWLLLAATRAVSPPLEWRKSASSNLLRQ